MTETKRLALVAKVTDKIGREGKDDKSTFSTSDFVIYPVGLAVRPPQRGLGISGHSPLKSPSCCL